MVALFLALLLQGFETRLALGGLRTELQNATLDRAAIRTDLQGEIGAVRTDLTDLQGEIGAVRTDLTETQDEIIAVVSDIVTELTRPDSPTDRPARPPR